VTDRVRGITGDPEAVREMARGFNIYFKRIDTSDGDDDYTMDHTASVILLDSEGRFRKTIAFGEDSESAIQKLRDLAGT
jgi:protein SCO1/2